MAATTEKLVSWASDQNVGGMVERAHNEAARRGHPKTTAFAGVGGLLGGILGSFRGPVGAALGGLLGALLGSLFGLSQDRQRAPAALPPPRARHLPVRRTIETVSAAPPRHAVPREYADVTWRSRT